ncbi:glycosyltransferase [Arthrobacter antioxidans]|uniref:glycosyltransferase n=1 Tax=Arthrobacter antioxidans TaxID=2895818 RepID=UPI001FFF767C|nr:glycosyltransferase [Arthrobacter antioxidans]
MENQESLNSDGKVLPHGYHCAIAWSIPHDFGGMTNALFHRSRAFVREAGEHVDILTFGYEPNLDDIRCELEVDGVLIPGLALRNLWEELADLDDASLSLASVSGHSSIDFQPLSESDDYREVSSDTGGSRRTRTDSSGQILQTDYLREDGTLVVSDRLDRDNRGVPGGRLVTLCDRSGKPIVSWRQIWPLYLFWLDHVIAARETYMIIDSKFAANFMTRYRRPNVVTLHQLHSSHVVNPPHGDMSPSRRYTFDRLHLFDGVVLLTERQKRDVDLVFDPPGNTYVVPNSRNAASAVGEIPCESRSGGLVLARFTKAKRLDHAIKATQLSAQKVHHSIPLRIFGGGSQEESLKKMIDAGGAQDEIAISGFDPKAAQYFGAASFTLLTSRSEGQPLVLLEAMSAGCIPVSYDIAYGPADIITDGIDGFLVADGDVEAMADKIALIEQMDGVQLAAMRCAAIRRASEFSDRPVVARWGECMKQAADRKVLAELRELGAGLTSQAS